MARLALAVQAPLSAYPDLPLAAGSADVEWAAAGVDFADGASFPMTAREVLLVRNPAAGVETLSIDSVADSRRRTGDIVDYAIDPDEVAVFFFNRTEGWRQSDGSLHFEASDAGVEFAVIRLEA